MYASVCTTLFVHVCEVPRPSQLFNVSACNTEKLGGFGDETRLVVCICTYTHSYHEYMFVACEYLCPYA